MTTIYVPDGLPVREILRHEGINNIGFLSDAPADSVRMALVNLMPEKEPAEADWIRLLATCGCDVPIALRLFRMGSHVSKHTSPEHLVKYYEVLESEQVAALDGVIMNGAPLERVAYPDTDYWEEACRVMDTTLSEGVPVMYVCWGAFAAMYHRHGVDKLMRPDKLSGVYAHRLTSEGLASPLGKGLEDGFYLPHSRHCILDPEAVKEAVARDPALMPLAVGEGGAAEAVWSDCGCDVYFTGHPEYAPGTLDSEYRRDMGRGMNPHIPDNYYVGGDPSRGPLMPPLWRRGAQAMMYNWLVNFVLKRHEKR